MWPRSNAQDSAATSAIASHLFIGPNFREVRVKKDKNVPEGKLTQNQIRAFKGMECKSVETSSPVSLCGGPDGQSPVEIFFSGGKVSIEDRLQYLENDMC